MHRLAIVLAIALPLAAADLVWKSVETTPSWAYHQRSPAWLALSLGLVAVAFAVSRIRSTAVLVAAGVMAGGVLGNALSGAWNDLRVPNPLVVTVGDGVVAFNLADILTMLGILGLTAALGIALIRNRHVLPTRREARAMVARAVLARAYQRRL
jgi:hypothetical protein